MALNSLRKNNLKPAHAGFFMPIHTNYFLNFISYITVKKI